MNPSTIRMMKEARALFWPWCLVTLAGASPWPLSKLAHGLGFRYGPLDFPSSFALWIGIPLLAALSLGNEFQHRTFSLMLSQPVDRMRIWREKWTVTMIAVLSAAAVNYFASRATSREDTELGML